MKGKRYLFILVSTLIIVCLFGETVFASGWYGPNSYSTSHNYSHLWGSCTLYPRNQWYEYWDDGAGRYTQYKIMGTPSGSCCQIYVSSSDTYINDEVNCLYDYDLDEVSPGPIHYYDIVYPGYSWLNYYYNSSSTLTKPSSDDGTYMRWRFYWQAVGAPFDAVDFQFASRNFLFSS